MNALTRLRERPESGMTLVELLIYSLLLVVVLVVAGGIMISSLQSQQTVSTVSSAASTGQLVSTNVSQGIRNASAFQVSTPTGLGDLLRSRTVSVTSAGVATWQCQAWFRTSGGRFYIKSASSAVAAPAVEADLATWTLIAEGVELPPGASQAFNASSGQLTLAVSVTADDAAPVLISTTIVSRPQTDTGTAPTTCF
jgi:Tfp pilus assembly protein PilV